MLKISPACHVYTLSSKILLLILSCWERGNLFQDSCKNVMNYKSPPLHSMWIKANTTFCFTLLVGKLKYPDPFDLSHPCIYYRMQFFNQCLSTLTHPILSKFHPIITTAFSFHRTSSIPVEELKYPTDDRFDFFVEPFFDGKGKSCHMLGLLGQCNLTLVFMCFNKGIKSK